MVNDLDARRSVEALHAYLIAYAHSLDEGDRAMFSARMSNDPNFARAILETLHAAHDALVSCLSEGHPETAGRAADLLESESLADAELSKAAIYILTRFSRAIVMDLDADAAAGARARLDALLVKARARVSAVKLH